MLRLTPEFERRYILYEKLPTDTRGLREGAFSQEVCSGEEVKDCGPSCWYSYVCMCVSHLLIHVLICVWFRAAPPSGGSSGGVGQGPNPNLSTSPPSVVTSQATPPVTRADDASSSSSSTACFPPGIPQNGARNSSSTDQYNVNDVVVYRCEDGFRLVGASSRSCQSSGQWTGSLPRCEGEL